MGLIRSLQFHRCPFGDVALEDSDGDGFHESLVHVEPRRVCMFRVQDEHACIQDTHLFEHEFVKIFPTVFPLLSDLACQQIRRGGCWTPVQQ